MVQFKNSPLTEEFWEIHPQQRKEKTFVTCGHVDNYYVTPSGDFVLVVEVYEKCYVEGRYASKENQNAELMLLLKDFNCLRHDETVTLKCLSDYMAVDVTFEYSENCGTFFATSICCNDRLHCKFSDAYSTRDLQKIMENCYYEQGQEKRTWGERDEIAVSKNQF